LIFVNLDDKFIWTREVIAVEITPRFGMNIAVHKLHVDMIELILFIVWHVVDEKLYCLPCEWL
jgi:hypothetical protein